MVIGFTGWRCTSCSRAVSQPFSGPDSSSPRRPDQRSAVATDRLRTAPGWNAGTALVAIGVPTGLPPCSRRARLCRPRAARSSPSPCPTRSWLASACAAGAALVSELGGPSYPCGVCRRHAARGVSWSHGDLLGAHLALTLAGWLGIAIIGPLHTFFRSLTQHSFAIPASSRPPISSGCWAPSSSLSALTSLRGLCWRVPALLHRVGRVLADRDKTDASLWRGFGRGDPEWQRLRHRAPRPAGPHRAPPRRTPS